MPGKTKITTGTNDRPADETISQTGEGLPDDSSRAPETNAEQIGRARRSLGTKTGGDETRSPAEEGSNPESVPPRTLGSGENICRRCGGTGRTNSQTCPECEGTGIVFTPLGDG